MAEEISLKGVLPEGSETVELVIRGAKIAALRKTGRPATKNTPILSPGLIDAQVNGCLGRGFNRDEVVPEDTAAVAALLARGGVTHYIPTITTGPQQRRLNSCRAIAAACAQKLEGGAALGIHLEGPWLSPADGPRGAHNRDWMCDPTWSEFCRLQEAAEGRIICVTLAPERKGAIKFIERLAAEGVTVALGHHQADSEIIAAAVSAGASLCTHLGNGSHPVLPRLRNYVWDQLADDRLQGAFIADGHHLPDSALKCMLRAKGLERSLLVSDIVSMAGLPPGVYRKQGSAEAYRVLPTGKIVVVGREALAGSTVPLYKGVANVMRVMNLSVGRALALATQRPAEVFGRHAKGLGRLAVGAAAHVTVFGQAQGTLTVERVFRNGVELKTTGPVCSKKEMAALARHAGDL
jgi:N-acetylglucosamine-6-phosphate deacetylase